MSQHSKIEWTDATWPVVAGCAKVSPGCDNCYAIRDSHRLGGNPNRKVSGAYRGTTKTVNGKLNWSGVVRCLPERLEWPLKWKKPRRIFVGNESDLFHPLVPVRFLAEVWDTMAAWRIVCRQKDCDHESEECLENPGHIYQILTKRAERMYEMLKPEGELQHDIELFWPGDSPAALALEEWPLKNVWVGVSVENQKTADERIPFLLQTPATVRFVSYEPALGPVDFSRWIGTRDPYQWPPLTASQIDWLICGGESGPQARPAHPEWFRSVRDQCQAAGVPFFFKQWGEWIPGSQAAHISQERLAEAPTDLLTCAGRGSFSMRVGKRIAGRLLDGREWNEMPK